MKWVIKLEERSVAKKCPFIKFIFMSGFYCMLNGLIRSFLMTRAGTVVADSRPPAHDHYPTAGELHGKLNIISEK